MIGPRLHSNEQGITDNKLLWKADLEPVGGTRSRLSDFLLARH